MGVTVTRKGKPIALDTSKVLDWLASQAIGMIQRRTAKGIDLNGAPMKAYSLSYARQLVRMGEDLDVDLTVTGAMLADFRELSRTETSVTVGPGTGTSQGRSAKAGSAGRIGRANRRLAKDLSGGKGSASERFTASVLGEDRAHQRHQKSLKNARKSQKTGHMSPPHNVLASLIHFGTARMPARPFVGLTPAERQNLLDSLIKRVVSK